jgi:O-antigen/teichoic acid export membrane protein
MTEQHQGHDPRHGGVGQLRHLVRQSALLLTSGGISYFGGFVLNVVIARSLGLAGFGAYVVAFAVAKGLSSFGLMGADWIVLRQGAYYHGIGDQARLRSTIHLALVLSGLTSIFLNTVLFISAPLIATQFFDNSSLTPLLRVVSTMAPVMTLGYVMLYGTQAYKSMREVALVRNVLQPMVRIALVIAALGVSRSELSAVVGLLCAEVVLMIISVFALHRRLPLKGPTDPIDRKGLIRFALPVWGTKLIDITRSQLFPLLLGSLATLSASGVFVASQRIAAAPSAIIASLTQVYSPMGSDLHLQGRREEHAVLFKSIGKWSFTLGFPLFCAMVAFPDDLLSLFGTGFRSGASALVLLAIAMFMNFSTGPAGATLIMVGRAHLGFIDHVLVVAAEIGLSLWLLPRYGVIGAAVVRMIGTSLNNITRLVQVWWITGHHPYRIDYWKPAAAGVVATVLAKSIVAATGIGTGAQVALVASVAIGSLYVGLLLLLGLSEEDRSAVDALLRWRRRAASVQSGGVEFAGRDDPPSANPQ